MSSPRLTFICELENDALQALFAGASLIDELVALNATLCLGLMDHSPERAAVVRDLNRAGVPVVAWLLLPKDQGYWFNIDNATEATACYAQFKAWSESEALSWQAIAIDIEPDISEMQHLVTGDIQPLLPLYLRRAFDAERALNGRLAYGALVRDMRADGFKVISFQFPFIADERQAGSTLLQRVFGVVDVPVDSECFMLYSSFVRPYGPAVLSSYAPDAGAIAVGVTGAGVEAVGPQPLSWEELARDLRLAYRWSEDIAIYSLEGCVAQDYLSQLSDFDWEAPVVMPTTQIENVNSLRGLLRAGLWALSHPFVTLFSLMMLVVVLRRLGRLIFSRRS